MTRAPYVLLKSGTPWSREVPPMADSTVGWRFVNPRMKADWTISLGATAELVARQYGITRGEQDAYAAASHRKAAHAIREGWFSGEIVPVDGMSAETPYPEQYTAWHFANAPTVVVNATLTKLDMIRF